MASSAEWERARPLLELAAQSDGPRPGQVQPDAVLMEEEAIRMVQRLSLIQSLPEGTSGQEPSKERASECAICLLDFTPEGPVRRLPCLHTFHRECVDVWLLKALTCPLCRHPVVWGGPRRDVPSSSVA
ncbi:RING finger protein 11 [Galemys pyrenaicus]|uniref:RING finger protein 11 n=1 Tax=Galemys pyrenaicus TaxID=202257 RepID=A0A8J6AW45_GALPY|nr:RING finger protein 11 [Galemys pyrenaicus]